MTRKKKDNPAALGVMGVILVGALASVGKSLFSGEPPQVVRAARASAETPVEPAPRRLSGLPVSYRDPFSSPLLKQAAARSTANGPAPAPRNVGTEQVAVVRRPSPLVAAPVLTPLRPFLPIPRASSRATAAESGTSAPPDEMALVRSLRVTAIVMGAHPYAVLEPASGTPKSLHKTEYFRTLRLVAIRAGEIVLKGQSGLWTLPLATPETETPVDQSKN